MKSTDHSKATKGFRHHFRQHVSRKRLLLLLIILLVGIGYLYFQSAVLGQKNSFVSAQVDRFTEGSRIFTFNGDTFVRYDEPIISVTVYTTENCATCRDAYLGGLARLQDFLPTLDEVTVIDTENADVPEEIVTLPAFVFSDDIMETEFYKQGEAFFESITNESTTDQLLFAHSIGVEPQMYLTLPHSKEATSEDTTAPTKDPFRITAFMTTDCTECKVMHDVLNSVETTYGARVRVERIYSTDNQLQEHNATRALACADEQGKAGLYENSIYTGQKTWSASNTPDTAFMTYARTRGLDLIAFENCLKGADIASQATADMAFDRYGIVAVPTLFLEDEVLTGVQTSATIGAKIKAFETPATQAVTQ